MRITRDKLVEMVPDLDKNGITTIGNTYEAAKLIGSQYCTQLTSMGLCTEICENCSEHLYNMTRLKDANNWRGLLIWMAKNERAVVKEQSSTHEAVNLSDTGNVFADLLRMLE